MMAASCSYTEEVGGVTLPRILMTSSNARQFPCAQCGATLNYLPGSEQLRCTHCGHLNPIPQAVQAEPISELDYAQALQTLQQEQHKAEHEPKTDNAHCQGCGASFALAANVQGDHCTYCGAPVVLESQEHALLRPRALLPFKLNPNQAQQAFRAWLGNLWFAPSNLLQRVRAGALQGLYVPYWTYDSGTVSDYQGERGTYYYVTETYTVEENGREVTRTRQVRHTRWTEVSGRVQHAFDDVLVLASRNLPQQQAEALEPWDLAALVPYQEEYLSGFRTERYQVGLESGFERARQIMDGQIQRLIRHDIGGDEQRVHEVDTHYYNITFKHILLPVYLANYRHGEKLYRFVINARTGEVQGERPWSWVKVTFAVLVSAALLGLGVWLLNGHTLGELRQLLLR